MGGRITLNRLAIARRGYKLISVLFYISGLVCIIAPDLNPEAAAVAGGIMLILYGMIRITGYLSNDLYCLAFQHDFACGMLLMVLGIIELILHARFRGYLLPAFGILVLFDGLLCVQTAIDARRFGLVSWHIILAGSILLGVLGVVLIIVNTQMVAGCCLLAEGLVHHYLMQCTMSPSMTRQRHGTDGK
ncbi:MAG: hypothetical protein K1W23_04745 [Lachnospiraceae bacterium]